MLGRESEPPERIASKRGSSYDRFVSTFHWKVIPNLRMRAPKSQQARIYCRRHLNIRGKSANLPAITDKDWLDLKFGIDVGVDYYALSFVRNAEVIYELKRYLSQQGKSPGISHWPWTRLLCFPNSRNAL